jgi:hypothetical protein
MSTLVVSMMAIPGVRRDIRLAPAVCSMFATKRALMGALD